MRSSKSFLLAVAISFVSAAALAARFDFRDPRRALGREDDIRVDAQLGQDTLSPNASLSVTYQIENLTGATIAVADKLADMTFDPESLTITLSIGAEVPSGPTMPHLATVAPGEKRVFTAGVFVHVAVPTQCTPWTAVPRYVQIEVNILRDVAPFVQLIEQQARTTLPPPLPNDLLERWVENSDSVSLNSIPVRWKGDNRRGSAESDRPAGTF
jgi:hypothetical protein